MKFINVKTLLLQGLYAKILGLSPGGYDPVTIAQGKRKKK